MVAAFVAWFSFLKYEEEKKYNEYNSGIQTNLSNLINCAEAYMLSRNVTEVKVPELIESGFLVPALFRSVNGESYDQLEISWEDTKVTVIDKDGREYFRETGF